MKKAQTETPDRSRRPHGRRSNVYVRMYLGKTGWRTDHRMYVEETSTAPSGITRDPLASPSFLDMYSFKVLPKGALGIRYKARDEGR